MDLDPHAPHRDPVERLLQVVVLTLLVLASAAQLLAPPPEATPGTSQSPELELQARYILGVGALTGGAQESRGFTSLLDAAAEPVERLRLVPMALALGDRQAAEQRLDAARKHFDATYLEPFERLLQPGEIRAFSPQEAAALEEEHGWFGTLAAAIAAGTEASVRQRAMGVAVLIIAGLLLALLALATGSVLLMWAYRRWRAGSLRSAYADTVAEDGASRVPYLEALLVAIIGLQVLGTVAAIAMGAFAGEDAEGSRWPLLVNWLLLPLLAWPMWRGGDRASFLYAIGWTRGRGILKEVGCGVLAYVTAAPLLVLGFLTSALAARSLDQPPHHPILDWVQGADWLELAVVASVAVLWAPIVEESLFRGIFFHYLRGRLTTVASAFVVSLAFAALHPQGLAGLPFLISLAMALALVREWRGSLIAPVTVHLIHNGLVMTLLFSLL